MPIFIQFVQLINKNNLKVFRQLRKFCLENEKKNRNNADVKKIYAIFVRKLVRDSADVQTRLFKTKTNIYASEVMIYPSIVIYIIINSRTTCFL